MTGSKVVDKNNTIKENELHVAALKKQVNYQIFYLRVNHDYCEVGSLIFTKYLDTRFEIPK